MLEFILVSVFKFIVGIVGLGFGFDSWFVVFVAGFDRDHVASIDLESGIESGGLANASDIDLVTSIGVDHSWDLLELACLPLAILLRLVAASA